MSPELSEYRVTSLVVYFSDWEIITGKQHQALPPNLMCNLAPECNICIVCRHFVHSNTTCKNMSHLVVQILGAMSNEHFALCTVCNCLCTFVECMISAAKFFWLVFVQLCRVQYVMAGAYYQACWEERAAPHWRWHGICKQTNKQLPIGIMTGGAISCAINLFSFY